MIGKAPMKKGAASGDPFLTHPEKCPDWPLEFNN
jgi:hypothetical protein